MNDELRQQAQAEVAQLGQRYVWLERKIKRLPIGSNGRRRATEKQMRVLAYAVELDRALQGDTPRRLRETDEREVRNAWRLLNEIRHAGKVAL